MPYATNEDLPPAVQRNLPAGAQDVYRAAFNRAFSHYGPWNEAVAHRVAWAAVKRRYEKRFGVWARRPYRYPSASA